ncbi:MAG: DUF4982 domain-containing protein [Treponema sp.]|nr:DUF4982 domain-containing protein [Treponema sp.]MCL2236678.1 DUF4982 domain-containing protein [Treponema sp.]
MNSFNHNWKFILGDEKNAQSEGFNDRTWENVDLPHDWVISRPFFKGETGGWTPQNMQGFFDWKGVCWYRKEFLLPNINEKTIFIYFGGAYRNSTIFINGKEAAKRANGYVSFEVDITGFAKEGKNLVAVRLDNGCEEPDRWYSGSGLYRNVELKVLPPVHVKTWGVKVKTQLSKDKKQADVKITADINSYSPRINTNLHELNLKILTHDNKLVAEEKVPVNFNGKNEIKINQSLKIDNPALWSAENPNLYRAVLEILGDNESSVPVQVTFGIRTIEINYNKGMTVNGEKVKLKGVCLHHDAGIAGSAYYDDVWRRRLNILKSIGCNAIRTSHNPPAQEFLDLCDEMGFYVIDECFDKWKSGYYKDHFDEDAKRDLTDFILRDINHPCVFMWSVGNEVENQGQDSMIAIQKTLCDIVRSLDDRPVTCALAPHANPRTLVGAAPGELVKLTKKMAKDVDVLGFNYHEPLYEHYTKGIEKPIVGTECYEFYSSVGTNFEDVSEKNPWQFVLENDNVIGQFIWAGIDYLGECPWPAKGWSGSIIDICGFLKPNAYFRKSIWTEEPMIYMAFYDQHIKPDYSRGRWSFPKLSSHLNHSYFERQNVKLAVFTNCEEAQLFINDKKMGRRKKSEFANGIIEFPIEYVYGKIEIKGINNNKEVCSYELKTSLKEAQKIKLIPDKKEIENGAVAHVEINITDKNGELCPNEEVLVEFALEGDAKILGACSSDLNQNLGFANSKVVTSCGKALVLIRAGQSGKEIILRAYSENLKESFLSFKASKK